MSDLKKSTNIWLVIFAVYLVVQFSVKVTLAGALDLAVIFDVMFAPLTLILGVVVLVLVRRDRSSLAKSEMPAE